MSGNNSGACHLTVPVGECVVMKVIIMGLESLEVARPKSARQALPDFVMRMLS
jgi:hypothetical protein